MLKTAAAALLGLTATGFQPGPAPMYGVAPDPGAGIAEGDYARACPELERQAAIHPTSTVYFNLGVCFHEWSKTVGPPDKLGMLQDALKAFQQTLEAESARPEPRVELVDEVEGRIVAIERTLDEVERNAQQEVPAPRSGGAASCQCDLAPRSEGGGWWWLLAVALFWRRRG